MPAVATTAFVRPFLPSIRAHPRFAPSATTPANPLFRAAKCSMADKLAQQPTATPSWPKLAALGVPLDLVNGDVLTSYSKDLQYFRLFGQKEADVRLVFYRDHALWCPYCHKVQLLLEAKRIPYMVKKINMSCYGKKPIEFLRKVPSGLLPVIELDGKVVTESMDIMFLIEESFQTPYRATIPVDDNEMMQAFHRFMRLERVYMGAWLGALRGPSATTERGVEPVHHTLDLIERGLGEFPGPFFYPGDEPSFVDINFSTMFERSRSSLRYWRNLELAEGRPNLERWFRAWEAWEPSGYLRSDDWTHIGALPPQIGPVRFLRTRAPMSLAVETSRARHVLNDGPERKMQRHLAAIRLCQNAPLVVKDAIRGAKAAEPDHHHIDNALRIIAQVLFNPDLLEVLEERARSEIPRSSWKVVGDGLRFERIRCCAPRDMPAQSMEQFSGAINWLLRTLEQEL